MIKTKSPRIGDTVLIAMFVLSAAPSDDEVNPLDTVQLRFSMTYGFTEIFMWGFERVCHETLPWLISVSLDANARRCRHVIAVRGHRC